MKKYAFPFIMMMFSIGTAVCGFIADVNQKELSEMVADEVANQLGTNKEEAE